MYQKRRILATLLNMFTLVLDKGESLPQKLTNKQDMHPPTGVEKQKDICRNFTIGNRKQMEFYSPYYPKHYPNNTSCILKLEADYGYIIRLDFRDVFHLESSSRCEYDYLEIRDGAFGYSPLLGKFCGKVFPPTIVSSDRFLWLNFKSDETIEYEGFKASYSFNRNSVLDRPESPTCTFRMETHQGIISTASIRKDVTEYSAKWNTTIDCTWEILARPGYMIYLNFTEYELAQPNDCHMNFIEVFHRTTDMLHRKAMYCGKVAQPILVEDNVVFVRYLVNPIVSQKSNFKLLYTLYTRKVDQCEDTEFDCEDATCIHRSLRCNGHVNCKNKKDEEKCHAVKWHGIDFQSVHIIIILIVGSILIAAMTFVFFYNCISKLRTDHRSYQESIQQSPSDSLETCKEIVGYSPHVSVNKIAKLSNQIQNEYFRRYVTDVALNKIAAPAEIESNHEIRASRSCPAVSKKLKDISVQTRDSFIETQHPSSSSSDESDSLPDLDSRNSIAYFYVSKDDEDADEDNVSSFISSSIAEPVMRKSALKQYFTCLDRQKLRHCQTCPRIFYKEECEIYGRKFYPISRTFRTEAVIEIQRRPRSVNSTKSAPGSISVD